MYHVLIVDDEVMIKRSLTKLINQSPYGFQVVGEAEDGSEALALWERLTPHLVITDISMPVMDGLELISSIRSRERETEVVILSGYDDFAYAQQAVRYGIMDYVLKPVREEQLNEILAKAAEKIGERTRLRKDRGRRLLECQAAAAVLAEQLWLLNEAEAYQQLDAAYSHLTEQGISQAESVRVFEDMLSLAEGELLQRSSGKIRETEKPLFPTVETSHDLKREAGAILSSWMEQIRQMRNWGQRHSIQRAVEYIDKNFAGEELSLQSVADEAGMSSSYFSRLFKEELGVSFIDYITRLRMEKAKELLQEPGSKTYEIAYAVGYSDYPHFAKSFKKYCGFSPKEYKKRLTGG
ncbi:response regulator [Paenibacillus silviterrae]|uniref:response regulator n=1 Tax=Paenibacillus silviterrae TaxID=3242194 RepID=UPI002543C665|nr:response regulator [Paenibacillus chinjuensis]